MSDAAARPTVALVTISYAGDFERARLLVDSIALRARDGFMHYLVVDRVDVALFASLRSPRCSVLALEDLLPWWLIRTPLSSRFWLSLQTWPVRGWIVQQLAKLSIFSAIPEDIAVCCDSDCFFLRDFSLRDLVLQQGRLRLMQVPFENARIRKWNALSARLFGLPPERAAQGSFVGNLIPFRRSNLQALFDALAQQGRRDPLRLLAGQASFSEYSLYGTFVTQVMGLEAAGHRIDNSSQMKLGYGLDPDGRPDHWQQFFTQYEPGDVGAMIHSKDGIAVERYRALVLGHPAG